LLEPSSEDLGLEDSAVLRDTELYMRLSWLRLVEFLDAHGVSRQKYQVFTDLEKHRLATLRPGVAHRAHKPDFTYGFATPQLEVYSSLVRISKAKGPGRAVDYEFGDAVYQQCAIWVSMAQQRLETSSTLPGKKRVEQLIGSFWRDQGPRVCYVGGPFCDLASMMPNANFREVYAMGGFIDGSVNLFRNQFNILADPISAEKVLSAADDGMFDLVLLPTECAKGSPMEVTKSEMVEYGVSRDIVDLYQSWDPKVQSIPIFDWMLAVAALELVQFPLTRVSWKVEDGVFKFVSGAQASGGVFMYWNDIQVDSGGSKIMDANGALKRIRGEMLKMLKRTLA